MRNTNCSVKGGLLADPYACNQDATARAGFDRATRNVSRLGITFGGGCYFGHGVFVQNGQAKFVLESYRIGRPTS